MRVDPRFVSPGYEPADVFGEGQLAELSSCGCTAPLISRLAYLVGSQCDERNELGPKSSEGEVKRAAAEIAQRASQLREAFEQAPFSVRHRIIKALADQFERPDIPGLGPGWMLGPFWRILETIQKASEERSTLRSSRRRPQRASGRTEPFSLLVVMSIRAHGLKVTSSPNGTTARILETCRKAAGLDPASGETLARYYLRPALRACTD